jgi:hypothetical protein
MGISQAWVEGGGAARLGGLRGGLDRLALVLVESRSHRVICLVAGIWLLNGFDLALTLIAHHQGILQEQNPLASEMLERGTGWVTLYKVGLVLLGSAPLLYFRRARIAELGALVVLLAYATLAMHWSACYQMYTLVHTHGFTNVAAGGTLPTWP